MMLLLSFSLACACEPDFLSLCSLALLLLLLLHCLSFVSHELCCVVEFVVSFLNTNWQRQQHNNRCKSEKLWHVSERLVTRSCCVIGVANLCSSDRKSVLHCRLMTQCSREPLSNCGNDEEQMLVQTNPCQSAMDSVKCVWQMESS